MAWWTVGHPIHYSVKAAMFFCSPEHVTVMRYKVLSPQRQYFIGPQYAFVLSSEEETVKADGDELVDLSQASGLSTDSVYLSSTDDTEIAINGVAATGVPEPSDPIAHSANDSLFDSSLNENVPSVSPHSFESSCTLNTVHPTSSYSPNQQDLFDFPVSIK